nr:uncharacterized protein LOC113743889 [Coffea arabica]
MDMLDDIETSCNCIKRLTNEGRQSIFETLLQYSDGGKLRRGTIKNVANLFQINVITRFPKRPGRKQVEIDFTSIMTIPLRRRTNIRSLSSEMKVAKSTLHRRIKEGAIRPHSNALKPQLTDENKQVRLRFCLSMLESESLNTKPVFRGMFNVVHVDEKWFYMTKESERYYLHPEEEQPLRTCKSKKFIAKVMFLVAVVRPRFDCSYY